MKVITLEAITAKAAEAIREHGKLWRVMGRIDNPDPYFFQSRKPHLYISPLPRPARNPRENLGDNYTPSGVIANAGARYILENNDPDFEIVVPNRKAA